MVEVFKTNVDDSESAVTLAAAIHKTFESYCATFDLEDCDKILRVECSSTCVENSAIIQLLKDHGFTAEVLPEL
ncbi:MAG TPA: hypothetical protein VG737_11180 [Cyclobacteriaceae bacterium]|nr:hypothetical protein [Cyclobacteriaceae bacterium]